MIANHKLGRVIHWVIVPLRLLFGVIESPEESDPDVGWNTQFVYLFLFEIVPDLLEQSPVGNPLPNLLVPKPEGNRLSLLQSHQLAQCLA